MDTGDDNDQRLSIGVSRNLLRSIDEWRRQHPDLPSRAGAARMILEAGARIPPAGSVDPKPQPKQPTKRRKQPDAQ
jgi:hypothetical protein